MSSANEIRSILRGYITLENFNKALTAATKDLEVDLDEKVALGTVFLNPFYVEKGVTERYAEVQKALGLFTGGSFNTTRLEASPERIEIAYQFLKERAAPGIDVKKTDKGLVIEHPRGSLPLMRRAWELALSMPDEVHVPVTVNAKA